MFASSRLLARSTGSAIARSSFLLPSARASSSGISSSSEASAPTPSPSPSSSSSSVGSSSPSGYYLTAVPREAVVPIGWSRPDATLAPSSPHSTILTDPTNLNLAHHLLPSTPHSPATLLRSQTQKYLVAKLHAQRLLLHPTDIVTIPLLSDRPALGSQLHLTRVLEVGSRDFTLRAPLGQRLTEIKCALTVLEHTQVPMSITNKKKRRKGYQKEVRNKPQFTRLRVGEIEIVGDGGAGAEDEKAPERRLDRDPYMRPEEYKVTDQSMDGRLAVNYGITRPVPTQSPPPRPVD